MAHASRSNVSNSVEIRRNAAIAIAAGAAAALGGAYMAYKWLKRSDGRVKDSGSLLSTDANDTLHRNVFDVSPRNGYLPSPLGLRKLPSKYAQLEELMQKLPYLLQKQKADALAEEVALLELYDVVSDLNDPILAQALMRDYSMLIAAYLLEGKTKSSQPRTVVPRQLSIPFDKISRALDEKPIMSYDSYALNNFYSLQNKEQGDAENSMYCWENLRLIRAFDGGPEEATFILVHIEIESHTSRLIQSYNTLQDAVAANDLEKVRFGLEQLKTVQEEILTSQLKMFNASDPRNYEKFVRPWIFGYKGNPDFPDGVIFDGAKDRGPHKLRGETGAQSTIIPSMDAVLGIEHKHDQLRVMLIELEEYRPKPQRQYLRRLRNTFYVPGGYQDYADHITQGVSGECPMSFGSPRDDHAGLVSEDSLKSSQANIARHRLRSLIARSRDHELIKLFNECVRNVFYFRHIHVIFADIYIARYTKRENATGGTPYKAYLRKHRDESIAQQIHLGDPALDEQVLLTPEYGRYDANNKPVVLPDYEEYQRQVRAADDGPNGIPQLLLDLHHNLIVKYGRGHRSLREKMFPSVSDISSWNVSHRG